MTEEILEQKVDLKTEKVFAASFTGTGKEYFNIWIVNLVLSILTLGIYSAWATVRNRKYIYGHTWLDEHNFDFHGNPRSIVVGRMIAIVLLALYLFGDYLNEWLPVIVLSLVGLLLPFLVVRSMRFRLRNTSYRNLRFDFTGDTSAAFKAFLPAYVLGVGYICFWVFSLNMSESGRVETGFFNFNDPFIVITVLLMVLGVIIYPVFVARRSKFFFNNLKFGDVNFSILISQKHIYSMYFSAFGIAIGMFLVLVIISIFLGSFISVFVSYFKVKAVSIVVISVLSYLCFVLPMLYIYAYWKTSLVNHIFQQSKIHRYRMRTDWRTDSYWKMIVGNLLITVFTLGLGYPWASIRLARYKADNFAVYAKEESLESIEGSSRTDSNALGEEMTDAFDFEFGI